MPSTVLFNPDPPSTDRILQALADPTQSFAATAAANSTTIEALSLWIAGPDILSRLTSLESTAAWHTRFLATLHTHQALHALTQVLSHPGFPAAAAPAAQASNTQLPEPGAPGSSPNLRNAALRTAILHHRSIETVRKAATSILTLTRFRPLDVNLPTAGAPVPAATRPAAPTTSTTPPPASPAPIPSRSAARTNPAIAPIATASAPPAPSSPFPSPGFAAARSPLGGFPAPEPSTFLSPLSVFPAPLLGARNAPRGGFPSASRLTSLAGAATPRAP